MPCSICDYRGSLRGGHLRDELMRRLACGLLLVLVGASMARAETSTAEGPTQELAIYAVQRLFPTKATVKDLVCREQLQMTKVRWRCTVYWEE